jgi:hypothetical protein
MSLINSARCADKQILTDCYVGDILERLQKGVFLNGKNKHALLRLTFPITNIPAVNKPVTRALICKVLWRRARVLDRSICGLINTAEMVTKWRSIA